MLLVTLYLPPSRTMAAVRLGKLARYLLAQGHDVRVVTPLDPPLPQDLAVDFPADRVVRTPWQPPLSGGQLTHRAPAPAPAGTVPEGGVGKRSLLNRTLWRLPASLPDFPANRAPWLPFPVHGGAQLLAGGRPAPPF